MAYIDLYTSSFDDLGGTSIDVVIQEEDLSGSSTAIKLDGNKSVEIFYNLKDRVFSTGAVVNIVNDFDDKFLFAKMIAEPYETYKLVIKKADAIYFEGYLLPQTFSQNVSYRSFVALTFSNGLTMLENFTPSFLTTGVTDYITEMDILENIFSYLSLDYTIYINSSLYEDSMASDEDNPLDATYLNRLAFQKNNGDWDNALEILNKILKSINAYCYIRDERIMIERFVDKATNPKDFWTWEIGSSSGQTGGTVQEAFTEKNLDTLTLKTDNIQHQADPPVKKLKLKLNVLTFNNIFANHFDRNIESAVGYVLFYWTWNQYIVINDTNFSNAFITRGIDITKRGGDSWGDFGLGHIGYQGIFSNPNDEVVFDLKFKYWGGIITGKALDFTYIISFVSIPEGDIYYIKTDGSVASGAGGALLTAAIENNTGGSKYDFSINKTFDLTGLLNAVDLDGDSYVRIRVYPPNYYDIGSGEKTPIDGIYGDFSLNQNNVRINNLLEANLNNEAFKTVEEELDLYDAGYVNYRVTKLLKVTNGYESTNSWTDDLHSSKSLQQHYILNRGNLWNASSPILVVIVNDRTANIKIDDIFYTSLLKDDLDNNMKFYVADFKYNMRQHTYTLTLKKWLATVGKNIT